MQSSANYYILTFCQKYLYVCDLSFLTVLSWRLPCHLASSFMQTYTHAHKRPHTQRIRTICSLPAFPLQTTDAHDQPCQPVHKRSMLSHKASRMTDPHPRTHACTHAHRHTHTHKQTNKQTRTPPPQKQTDKHVHTHTKRTHTHTHTLNEVSSQSVSEQLCTARPCPCPARTHRTLPIQVQARALGKRPTYGKGACCRRPWGTGPSGWLWYHAALARAAWYHTHTYNIHTHINIPRTYSPQLDLDAHNGQLLLMTMSPRPRLHSFPITEDMTSDPSTDLELAGSYPNLACICKSQRFSTPTYWEAMPSMDSEWAFLQSTWSTSASASTWHRSRPEAVSCIWIPRLQFRTSVSQCTDGPSKDDIQQNACWNSQTLFTSAANRIETWSSGCACVSTLDQSADNFIQTAS